MAYDKRVECPADGCIMREMMHPIKVAVNAGGSITKVDRYGTRMESGRPDGRGVKIVVTFACEENHVSEFSFHFHKGGTYVAHEFTGEHDERDDWYVIWRD